MELFATELLTVAGVDINICSSRSQHCVHIIYKRFFTCKKTNEQICFGFSSSKKETNTFKWDAFEWKKLQVLYLVVEEQLCQSQLETEGHEQQTRTTNDREPSALRVSRLNSTGLTLATVRPAAVTPRSETSEAIKNKFESSNVDISHWFI